MKSVLVSVAVILSLVAGTSPAQESAAAKGLRIAKMADARDDGIQDTIADGQMILQTAGGSKSTRRFQAKTVEGRGGNGGKSLLVFDWPGNIRGTALLTHSKENANDQQWLYLPSIGRVKKISASSRSGSFVGSEFAYEDFSDQVVSNYKYQFIREEACPVGGGSCHVIARIPKHNSGYRQQTAWIDTQNLQYRQIYYYDRRGAHLKTLQVTGYKRYLGKFDRPSRMVMVNHLTKKRTTLNWGNYRFRTGLKQSEFTASALPNLVR